jgi:altronate dehydratase
MAIANLNALFKELKGALGKQIVIKQYKNKTVVTAYPSTKKRKPTKLQSIYRDDFAKAVKYAQDILRNPAKKKAYEKKVKAGQTVYNYAIAEYKKKCGVKKGK